MNTVSGHIIAQADVEATCEHRSEEVTAGGAERGVVTQITPISVVHATLDFESRGEAAAQADADSESVLIEVRAKAVDFRLQVRQTGNDVSLVINWVV